MADIRIDRYEVDVSSDGQTFSVSDIGDITKAFVRFIGSSSKVSGGQPGLTSNISPANSGCATQLTATDQVTFYKQNSNTVKVMFEIWSYTGNPGGAYEFIVRQRGNLTLADGDFNNSAPITGLSDRNLAIPIYNGFVTGETSQSDYEAVTLATHVNSSGEIVISRNNDGSGSSTTAYYVVPEFTGSAWSVFHGISSSHDTGNDVDGSGGEIITLNTDSTGAGGTASPVTDWGKATIFEATMEGDTSETGLSDCQLVVMPDGSNVRFTLENSNSRNDGDAYCHILQCADLAVSRQFQYNFAEGNNSYGTLPVPAGTSTSTPLSELGLEWMVCTSGEGTAWARGCLVAQITANTGNGLQHWVHRQGNNVSASYAFIDVSALTDAGGGATENLSSSFSSSSTLTANVSFVPTTKQMASSMSSSSGVTGNIGIVSTIKNASVTIQGNSQVDSDISLAANIKNLVSTLTGISSLSGDIGYVKKTKSIEVNISGSSVQSSNVGYVQEVRSITVDISGGSNVSATLQHLSQNIQLSTDILGSSTTSANISYAALVKSVSANVLGQSDLNANLSYISKTVQSSIVITGGCNVVPIISYKAVIKNIESALSCSSAITGDIGFASVTKQGAFSVSSSSVLQAQAKLYGYLQSTIEGSSQLEGLLQEKVFGPEWREVYSFVCELERVFTGTSLLQRSVEAESEVQKTVEGNSQIQRNIMDVSEVQLSVIEKSNML